MNINNQTLAELAAKNQIVLLKNYYRNQAQKQHTTISSLADLLDALPCYRQILLAGNCQSHPQDFLREILFGALEQPISSRYFATPQEAEDFIPYYCLRRHNITWEDLKTGNLTQEQLSAIKTTLNGLKNLPLTVTWPKLGTTLSIAPTEPTTDKLWVVSSLDAFYPPYSAEDRQTQTMSILNDLKQQAEQAQQTHLIWLETEQNTLDGVIRSEGLQLADLVLNLQVTVKNQQVVYELTSYKNTLGQPFCLSLAYDADKHQFSDLL